MIEKGSELYLMWADCFKVFDCFSDASSDDAYWEKVLGTARQVVDGKYKNSRHFNTMAALMSGVIKALEEESKINN